MFSSQVAELKMELKCRFLPVSGTKTDLIERLKLYQENSNIQIAVVTGVSQSDHKRLTPPVSPIASKVSTLGIEDSNMSDSKLSEALSPAHTAPCGNSPQRSPQEERPTDTRSYEKDKRLHDKERQIEELIRKLEREQRLVEELKMQLEAEKRSQQADPPARLVPLAPVRVKEENGTTSNGSASCVSPGLPPSVKQEEAAPQSQFIISDPTFKQPKTKAEARNLRPASAVTTQLPASSLKLHTPVCSADPGFILTSGQVPQKTEASAALRQQCSPQTQTKVRKHARDSAGGHAPSPSISHHYQP